MSVLEDRLGSLAREQFGLDRDPDLDAKGSGSGISPVDVVAFVTKAGAAFGVDIPPGDVAQLDTLRSLADWLDAHGG